jgi:hypothetical protein
MTSDEDTMRAVEEALAFAMRQIAKQTGRKATLGMIAVHFGGGSRNAFGTKLVASSLPKGSTDRHNQLSDFDGLTEAILSDEDEDTFP